ncbi:MAG: hypothetical protein ACXQT6_05405, partial [Candidatus Methanospirareceae archaeon]
MTLGSHVKTNNLFRSFCRLLASRIGESELFINWGGSDLRYSDLFIPENKPVWAEVKLSEVPGGHGDEPTIVEIHIYSRIEDDPFQVQLLQWTDRIVNELNVE